MKTLALIISLSFIFTFQGCYTKKVEKTVEPTKDVVIHDRNPGVVIHEHDAEQPRYRRKDTVIEY